MAEGKLEKLNITPDELSKLSNAFQNEQFRELFRQYLEDISDPVNRKIYEEEITLLEKQQGRHVVFVKPQPNYAIKTTCDGTKTYVNFCTSDSIATFSSSQTEQRNVPGVNLSIPYSLSPLQRKYDKCNNSYHIYTVVFHPETLNYAGNNAAVRKLVHDTAFDAVEKTFKARLDRVNYVVCKKSHKGDLEPTIIRRNDTPNDHVDISKQNGDSTATDDDGYVKPSYSLVYRNEMDLQNCTNHVYSKMNALIPTHTIVEINLPLLDSVKNTKLDVNSSSLYLQNDQPVKYKLHLPLAYDVQQHRSTAKFDADSHILRLELPVERKSSSNAQRNDQRKSELITELSDKLDDLRVEPSTIAAPTDRIDRVNQITFDRTFLRSDIKYKLPEYFCNYHQNKIVFVLKVKNVCFDSFKYRIFDDRKACIVKFSTLGAGHFPMYYSFCVAFAKQSFENVEPLQHLIEDDGIFLYTYLQNGETPLEYLVGTDPDNLKKAYLDEPEAIPLEIEDKKKEALEIDLQVTTLNSQQVTVEVTTQKKVQPKNTRATIRKASPETNGNSAELEPDLKSASLTNQQRMCDQFLDNINFAKFCTNNTSEDEKQHSFSETEMLPQISYSSSSYKETNSDMENHSWIVESKNVKKARRKNCPTKNGNENLLNSKSDDDYNHENVFSTTSAPIDIHSAYKYANKSGRGILKKNRSFSESSGDELSHVESCRSFSIDDINFSSDSYSHSAPKKSVTFNDVISKKLYSSDISILEQRKRTKRRIQRKERRASESDTSETECSNSTQIRRENVKIYNENLLSSENELTSVSESGETSDDQSDTQENTTKSQHIPCSKKNHKRKGKKSARKNASTAKHNSFSDDF